jgi:hypothetical protein
MPIITGLQGVILVNWGKSEFLPATPTSVQDTVPISLALDGTNFPSIDASFLPIWTDEDVDEDDWIGIFNTKRQPNIVMWTSLFVRSFV